MSVKIFFPIEGEATSSGITGEWLWAIPVDAGKYSIDNSPFNVCNVSYRDIVSAEEIDGVLTFVSIYYRGGHSTYRIQLSEKFEHDDFLRIWRRFEKYNCSYEGASSENLYAIDIPPEADVHAVYSLLEEGEENGEFQFEEGHYCRPIDRN